MPTVENFRAALNDVAADTPPLPSDQVLRAGRSLRRRRRVLAGCGTALAVAGIATGVGIIAAPSAPAPLARASSPAISAATSPATSPASAPVAEDPAALLGDLAGGGAENGVAGDVAAAEGKGRVLAVSRQPGTAELPPAAAGATTRTINGVEVRVTSGENWTRYEWIAPGRVLWALAADPPLDDDVLSRAVDKISKRR